MGKVYKGQTALRLVLKTFTDLEDASSVVIRFTKPDGATGEFAAAVKDSVKGIIIHEIIEGEIDVSGWWTFWAFIVFADGRSAAGEAAKVFVFDEGK